MCIAFLIIAKDCETCIHEKISMEMDIYREQDMLHHMATIFAKMQKSSDLGKIWFPSRL
jgi:hypothetical protein